jgi:hypothetical protein
MSTASFAPKYVRQDAFMDVGHVDGVAHALQQRSAPASQAAAEPAGIGGEAVGRTREHYREYVGLTGR